MVVVGAVVAEIVVVEAERFKQLHAAESLVAAMRSSFLVRKVGQPVGKGRPSVSAADRLLMTRILHVMVDVDVVVVTVVVRSVTVAEVVIVLFQVSDITTLVVG